MRMFLLLSYIIFLDVITYIEAIVPQLHQNHPGVAKSFLTREATTSNNLGRMFKTKSVSNQSGNKAESQEGEPTPVAPHGFTDTTNQFRSTSSDLNSKSTLYSSIYQHIPFLANSGVIHYKKCENHCGISFECSCKPICIILKTCCFDFRQSCGDFYNITEEVDRYSWLRSVSTECISNSIVVTSCAKMAGSNQAEGFQESAEWPNDDLSVNLQGNSSAVHGTAPDSLATILTSLVMLSRKGLALGRLEEMLISTPVLDVSTGITYRNISLLLCNEGNIRLARLWAVTVPVDEVTFIPANQIKRFEDFIPYVNFSRSCLNFPAHVRMFSDNLEQCNTEVVATCPHGYADRDVEEACEEVNFFMETIPSDGQAFASVTYKNPFCAICNLGVEAKNESMKILPWASSLAPSCANFSILVNFNQGAQSVLIRQGDIDKGLKNSWDTISCAYSTTERMTQTRRNLSAEMISREGTDKAWSLTTDCELTNCVFFERNRCQHQWTFTLAFPPAQHHLKGEILQSAQDAFQRTVLNNAIWASTTTYDSLTYTNTYDRPKVLNGRQYRYFLHVTLDADVIGSNKLMRDRLAQPVLTEVLLNFTFPSLNNKNYVCFTVPPYPGLLYPESIFCGDDYLFYLPGNGDSNHSMTSEAGWPINKIRELSAVPLLLCALWPILS